MASDAGISMERLGISITHVLLLLLTVAVLLPLPPQAQVVEEDSPQYICPEKVDSSCIMFQIWQFLFFKNSDGQQLENELVKFVDYTSPLRIATA